MPASREVVVTTEITAEEIKATNSHTVDTAKIMSGLVLPLKANAMGLLVVIQSDVIYN